MRLIYTFLLALSLSFGAYAATAPDAKQITQELEQAKAAKPAQPETVEVLQSALNALEERKSSLERARQYQDVIDNFPKLFQSLRAQLNNLSEEPRQVPTGLTADALNQEILQPADFCRYHGEVYGVAEGRLTVMKSDKDALTVGEDGFLGPFANEGDKVSWQVQAPWSGQFLLNVTFNGKWGGKQNSFVVNGVAPQAVAFPQTDEQGQQLRIPVTLKAGSNQIDFGRFAGDWGYMFIKSIEVVAE